MNILDRHSWPSDDVADDGVTNFGLLPNTVPVKLMSSPSAPAYFVLSAVEHHGGHCAWQTSTCWYLHGEHVNHAAPC